MLYRAVNQLISLTVTLTMFSMWMAECRPGMAQTANTGVITGVAKDIAGAVVAGATVTVTNKATGVSRMTTTGDAGAYELTQIVPGEYRLEVNQKGFVKFIQ